MPKLLIISFSTEVNFVQFFSVLILRHMQYKMSSNIIFKRNFNSLMYFIWLFELKFYIIHVERHFTWASTSFHRFNIQKILGHVLPNICNIRAVILSSKNFMHTKAFQNRVKKEMLIIDYNAVYAFRA